MADQAAKSVVKKLSALRATMSNEERAVLDGLVSDVSAHSMSSGAAGAVAKGSSSVVAKGASSAVAKGAAGDVSFSDDEVSAHAIAKGAAPGPVAGAAGARDAASGVASGAAGATDRSHRYDVVFDDASQAYRIID